MQTPYKKVIVYDLETGGLSNKYNQITEIAAVVLDMENLSIVDQFSALVKPRMNLNILKGDEPIKVAKLLYKNLSRKDEAEGRNLLAYKEQKLNLKDLSSLEADIESFFNHLESYEPSFTLELDAILELENTSEYKDIVKIFFDLTYSPQALEVTHIPRELFQNEGLPQSEVFSQFSELIKKHTVGNSKPILAGHNIKGFDNAFLVDFFNENKASLFKVVREDVMIDTLEEARKIWFEAPSYALGSCANMLGITLKEAHRALPDTIANAKVLVKMLKRYRGEGTKESKYIRRKFKMIF